jgi:hypothetical protein
MGGIIVRCIHIRIQNFIPWVKSNPGGSGSFITGWKWFSREHVLHHTMPDTHSRPFPGEFPLPESAIMITMRVYLRILGRMLVGKVDEENFQ